MLRPREPYPGEVGDAVFDALSEEEWHYVDRQFTFGGYTLLGVVVLGISIWQAVNDPQWFWQEWYRPIGAIAALLVAFSAATLYVNTALEMKRIRKKLKKLRPEVYL